MKVSGCAWKGTTRRESARLHVQWFESTEMNPLTTDTDGIVVAAPVKLERQKARCSGGQQTANSRDKTRRDERLRGSARTDLTSNTCFSIPAGIRSCTLRSIAEHASESVVGERFGGRERKWDVPLERPERAPQVPRRVVARVARRVLVVKRVPRLVPA